MGYETLSETEWAQVNRAWDLLDEGKVEEARLAVDDLWRKRPGQPDVRIVAAAVCLDEGEPEAALETLEGAERSADPAIFFYLRAVSRFELIRFEAAREDALRAVAVNPDLAEVAEQRRHLENDLRLALRDGDFRLYLQPIVDLDNSRLAGAEALLPAAPVHHGVCLVSGRAIVCLEDGSVACLGQ